MAHLTLSFLGGFQVARDGKPITDFRSDRVRALLIYLALEAHQPHRREALAALLWPTFPASDALHNLTQSLLRLGQALGKDIVSQYLDKRPQTLQFNLDQTTALDVADFTALVAACEQHRHRKMAACQPCIQRLTQAATLYQGELGAGLSLDQAEPFEEWLRLRRQMLHQQALDLLYTLAEYHLRHQRYTEAREYAQRQLALEPWREEASRQVMLALARTGQRSAALAHAQRLRQILAKELKVQPSPDTLLLVRQIESGVIGPAGRPAHHSALPIPPTPLVGREGELARVVNLLQDPGGRLVTLVGPAGIGKTRLALHVAHDLANDFADGVFFVPLATISDPALVPFSIAQRLGLREGESRSIDRRLKEGLRDKETLLVLDNFEQVAAASPLIAELLQTVAGLHILVTSRRGLRLRREQEIPVPPLALPDAQLGAPSADPARLLPYEAVRLFVERAQARWPEFRLTPENAATVLAICQRLDGVPLAIELAAARIKEVSPTAMVTRLGKPLLFLRGGAVDLPERHQSVRAALDWSYGLLTAHEQGLLRRLAVFVGGWTLEAVEAIGTTPAEDAELDLLDLLASLVNQSLVQRLSDTPRFGMLEITREYALEQLAASDEWEATQRQHAAFYLRLAEQADAELQGPRQQTWLAQLDLEHDNLRAALRWSLERQPQTDTGLRLAAALWRFWEIRGYLTEGRAWLRQALATPTAVATRLRAKALNGAGALAWSQGDTADAQRHFEESLTHWQGLNDAKELATLWNNLGLVARALGDLTLARSRFEASLTLRQSLGERRGIATTLNNLGLVARDEGQPGVARDYFEASLAIQRELDNPRGIATVLTNLAMALRDAGDTETARRHLEASLAQQRVLGDPAGVARTLAPLGLLARDAGDYNLARACFEESAAIYQHLGHRSELALSYCNLGLVAYYQGDGVTAWRYHTDSLRLFHTLDQTRAMADPLEGLARLVTSRQPEAAARLFGAAARLLGGAASPRLPFEQADYEREVAALQASLGEARFAAAWEAGRQLSLAQIISEALMRQ